MTLHLALRTPTLPLASVQVVYMIDQIRATILTDMHKRQQFERAISRFCRAQHEEADVAPSIEVTAAPLELMRYLAEPIIDTGHESLKADAVGPPCTGHPCCSE